MADQKRKLKRPPTGTRNLFDFGFKKAKQDEGLGESGKKTSGTVLCMSGKAKSPQSKVELLSQVLD